MIIIQKFLDEENRFKIALAAARVKGKELVRKLSEQSIDSLEREVKKALSSKGIDVLSLVMKLGKFRGYLFITSSKMSIKLKKGKFGGDEDDRVKEVLTYLQTEFSPKFKLKSVTDGIANFNVR